jgi:hypothetical protein
MKKLMGMMLKTLLSFTFLLATGNSYAAYPDIEILNFTDYDYDVLVHYKDRVNCVHDQFKVESNQRSIKQGRGMCLVSLIAPGLGTREAAAKEDTMFWEEYQKQNKAASDPKCRADIDCSKKADDNVKSIPNYNKYFKESHAYSSTGTSYGEFYIVNFQGHIRTLSKYEYNAHVAKNYPIAKIINQSKYYAFGKVSYSSVHCGSDKVSIKPAYIFKGKLNPVEWRAESRGACLITGVEITLKDGPNVIPNVINFVSKPGTGLSSFSIQPTDSGYSVITN